MYFWVLPIFHPKKAQKVFTYKELTEISQDQIKKNWRKKLINLRRILFATKKLIWNINFIEILHFLKHSNIHVYIFAVNFTNNV